MCFGTVPSPSPHTRLLASNYHNHLGYATRFARWLWLEQGWCEAGMVPPAILWHGPRAQWQPWARRSMPKC